MAADGEIDRAALAGIVFSDQSARRDLEAIVHPYVFGEIVRWFDSLAAAESATVAIADVPLLFETSHTADFDRIVVIACRPDQQVQRLMSRDGLSAEEAARRVAVQIPIDQKRARADDVIDTSHTEADTDRQVKELWDRLAR
jgi:dephospho-CoA kinase